MIIFLNNINQLVCITVSDCVFFEARTELVHII
jgi:hypothetical protein